MRSSVRTTLSPIFKFRAFLVRTFLIRIFLEAPETVAGNEPMTAEMPVIVPPQEPRTSMGLWKLKVLLFPSRNSRERDADLRDSNPRTAADFRRQGDWSRPQNRFRGRHQRRKRRQAGLLGLEGRHQEPQQVSLGRGCSTVVEYTLHYQEVLGSNPAGCWAFFSFSYLFLLSFTSRVSFKEVHLQLCVVKAIKMEAKLCYLG